MHEYTKSGDHRDENSSGTRGTTAVELLVVVIILSILAGVTIFAVTRPEGEANQRSCRSEKDAVQAAVETYKARYPSEDPSGIDTAKLQNPANGDPSKPARYWKVTDGVVGRTNTGEVSSAACH